ncbi:MFS transporter [Gorillibacterium massiliense]|uniref:MFS transporter n=1 Tax=Gorillibacterium massiliense TaxID=1280390 RepID=UPI00307C5DF1
MSSFFMFLTFYILATAFPLYVKDSMHGNQQQMGLTITVYIIGGVIGRPFSGLWVDRFGIKKMAVIGLSLFLLACIGYFGAKGILLFLAVRLVHGICYAVASTAISTAASAIIPDSRQGEGIGYYSMFMSIAMAVGPALGLLLWKDKNENILLLAVCLIAALSLAFALSIRLPGQQEKGMKIISPMASSHVKKPLHWSDFIELKALPISIVGFIVSFAYSSLSGFFASFAQDIHKSSITSVFFLTFAVMIVLFRPVIGKIFDKYKEHYLYYPGIVLFAIGMILLSQVHSGAAILLAGIIMGIGYGALLPCFQTLAVKLSPEHRRGSATGTFFLLFDLGYGCGSYFMGVIAAFTDYRMMYSVAGFTALLSVAFYYALHHRHHGRLGIRKKQTESA